MQLSSIILMIYLAADGMSAIPAGPTSKFAWVNPSRCLRVCDYDPSANLIRVNGKGVPDPMGKFLADPEAAPAAARLIADANKAGHAIGFKSTFRPYRGQAKTCVLHANEPGRAARPGHSEHQLGTAFDLVLPSEAAINWLAGVAHVYGFTLSYPAHKQRVTGYRTEVWHVRYVGVELASELYVHGLTLEEWFRQHPDRGESGDCHDCPLPASRAPCGKATVAGSCNGSVLTWCYDGALAKVDCGLSGDVCGRESGSNVSTCLSRVAQ